MKYIKKTTNVQLDEDTVISLGKFDGLHRGHKYLLEEMQKRKEDGLKTVLFTFDIPPKNVVLASKQKVLTTNTEKVEIFRQYGVDYMVEYPFTATVRNMQPEAFIQMLVKQFRVKCIVAGKDFHFGYQRKGNYETLLKFAKIYGYEAVIVQKKEYEHREISSSFIREEVQKGNMEKVSALLGYDYFICGEVVHGKKLGRVLGMPTINIIPAEEKLLPPFGVYASHIYVEGKVYGGITNIGIKPTVADEHTVGLETHIFDFHENLYHKQVKVTLLHHLRDERRFHTVEALQEQMQKDVTSCKVLLKK